MHFTVLYIFAKFRFLAWTMQNYLLIITDIYYLCLCVNDLNDYRLLFLCLL